MATRLMSYVITGEDRLTPVLRKTGVEGQAAAGKISTGMRAAGQAMLAFGTIAVAGLGAAVKAAQGLNLAQLQQSVKNAGIAWQSFKPQVDAAGQAMAKFGFTQGETNLALSRLITVTHNSGQSVKALTTIADLARYRHLSLAQATDLYTRAVAGNTRGLRMLGISADALPKGFARLSEAQRFNIVQTLLQSRVHGQAAAYANTFSGKLQVLRAQGTNLAASIGQAVIPMLSALIGWLSRVLAPIARNKAAFAVLATGIVAFSITARAALAAFSIGARAALVTSVVGIAILALTVAITLLLTHWNQVFGAMKRVVQVVGNAITTAFRAVRDFIINYFVRPVVNAFLTFVGSILHLAATAFGWIPGLGGKLRGAASEFDKFKNNVNKSLAGITAKKVVNVAAQFANTKGFSGNNVYGTGSNLSYVQKAQGGAVRGPGTSTSDSIPARLSNDEYVVNAAAHRHYGTGFLNAINTRRFASGGPVGVGIRALTPNLATIGKWTAAITGTLAGKVASAISALMGSFGGAANVKAGSYFQNLIAVARYFASIGYSRAAAAGIAGNVYRESLGNPESIGSGGGGLIGWTPLPPGLVTGNPTRDLRVQLPRIAAYNRIWGRYIPTLNSIASPWNAALYYMNTFERPRGAVYGSATSVGYSTAAGAMRAAMAMKVYAAAFDRGGILRPGLTMAYNGTGHNEFVTNPSRGGGGNTYHVTVNVEGHTLHNKQELGRAVSDALAHFENHGGRVPYRSAARS